MSNADAEDGDPFPIRLYNALHSNDDRLAEIVTFLSHGRAFRVHDRERFQNEVLNTWFVQTDWDSFQQQLDLHGFQRLTQGPDEGAYYHERFLQHQRFFVSQIRPQLNGPRPPPLPQHEPNFYRMPILSSPPDDTGAPREPSFASAASIDLAALAAPIMGTSALPPVSVGYPVLTRLMIPQAGYNGGGMVSNNILFHDNQSEQNIHNYLRGLAATSAGNTNQTNPGEDQDQSETKEDQSNAN